ncbi:hypothetical protein B0H11DRAFT_2228958 [Mycena galericulata]|nr:hypothetical protein B0H11DRAFT_2228958 [Mycena galericulata]
MHRPPHPRALITTLFSFRPSRHPAYLPPDIVVRAWACLLQPDDISHQESALYHVFLFLKPTLVEEIIDGAGGNIDDVVKLIMGQLALIAPDGKAPPPENVQIKRKLCHLFTIA